MAEQHHELVAAEPRDRVLGPGQRPQAIGDLDQHPVTGTVSEAVVDSFEVIQVDEQQGAGDSLAARRGDSLLHPVEQQSAVGQAGQGIEKGELFDGFLGGLALGDIRYRATHHHQVAIGVVLAFRLSMGPALVAQLILDAHVECEALAAQGLRQGIVDQRHVVGMDDAAQCGDTVGQRARCQTEDFLGVIGPTHELGGGGVLPAGNAIGAVRQADEFLAGGQLLYQPLALLIGPQAFGDIACGDQQNALPGYR